MSESYRDEPRNRERKPMTQVARRLRMALTPSEARVWECIRGRRCGDLRFTRQHDIGHFVLDFYCPAHRVALEIDGSVHALPEVERYDRERELVLAKERGVRFIRITNSQALSLLLDELRALVLAGIDALSP